MGGGTVAAGFATALLDYAASRGADRASLLANAGLKEDDLGDAQLRVPLDAYVALMRAAAGACGDQAFALHFGEEVDIREMSLAALIAQSSATGMDALGAANRYARLDADVGTDGPDRLRLVPEGAGVWLVDARTDTAAVREITESAFARMVSAARRAGLEIPLSEVHVTHAEPPWRGEYDRIFRAPVVFGSHWNALRIDAHALARPIAMQSALAGSIVREKAEALLARLDPAGSARAAVEATLRPRPGGAPGAEAVAASLGLSRATLYRRLKAEGATYAGVADGLRRRMAQDALADPRLSIPEVAYRTGFADRASFSKAFKRWTGATPAAYRMAIRAGTGRTDGGPKARFRR